MKSENKAPKVFISYSWDSEEHKEWVLNLAEKLRENGVNVILDRYALQKYGTLVPDFMEQSIKKSKRVICIMTPNYKKKTDKLEGGVGEEYSIIQAEISNDIRTKKFIPILKFGDEQTSIPTKFQGRYYVDMKKDSDFEEEFMNLLCDIHNHPKITPKKVGEIPDFDNIIRIRFTMHGPAVIRDELNNPSCDLYFLKIANLSDKIIQLSHIYLETETKQIFPEIKDRKLPIRLEPAEEWDTWIVADVLKEHLINKEDICKTGRVRLSNNNKIYKSVENIIGKDIPQRGTVNGGSIDVHNPENYKFIVKDIK